MQPNVNIDLVLKCVVKFSANKTKSHKLRAGNKNNSLGLGGEGKERNSPLEQFRFNILRERENERGLGISAKPHYME